jgi:hypothetical protein
MQALIDRGRIDEALTLLGKLVSRHGIGPYGLVVCGGAALISQALVPRVTRDVDVVALVDRNEQLISPDPMPAELLRLANLLCEQLELPDNWLNNGPSRNPGGLFQTGLPEGFGSRLMRRDYGRDLAVFFAARIDLIYFKVFAAVDQGYGRHTDDLLEMKPTDPEMAAAARWAITHDPSPGFRIMLVSMLQQLGFNHAVNDLQ